MNFFKTLFGGKEEKPEERKDSKEAKNFDVLKYDGVRALRSGHADYAAKCFNHALQMKDDLEVRDYLSQAYIHTGELSLAMEQLRKISEAHPDNKQVFMRIANVAFMMEDYTSMTEACKKAISIDANDPEAVYMYARACIGQDDKSKALELLSKAITLNADYADAYLLRSRTLLDEGNVEDADKDAGFLLKHLPDHEDVLLLKARIEKAKGDKDTAAEYYDKVIDANPFRTEAYRERGELRLENGDEAGAKEDLDYAKELSAQQNEQDENNGIEKKVNDIYRNNDPYGIFSR